MAGRLSVRQTRFTCIRVRMILYFRLPCLNNQQLSHTRASHRVWDWVTPHESVRKCQSQAQNQDPKLRRLARVARVDEPAQSMRLNERCTGLLLQPVKMWAKKKLCFSRASPPVAPPMPLLPRFGANRVNDTLCTHRNGPSNENKDRSVAETDALSKARHQDSMQCDQKVPATIPKKVGVIDGFLSTY